MIGDIMMSVNINPLFSYLSDKDKEITNKFIDFLYQSNTSNEFNEESLTTINDSLSGRNIVGTFTSIDDLMVALNEDN